MNRKQRINLGLALGTGALATYAGYTGLTWLLYGHGTTPHSDSLLELYMEEPEVSEQNAIEVDAPRSVAWRACLNFDLLQSRTIRTLFATRALLMRSPKAEPDLPKPFIEQVQALGWVILDEATGREIVIGAAAKPWRGDIALQAVRREEFAAFAPKGWAKIVWNISIKPLGRNRCVVKTETRVATTDAASRRRFRLYWAFTAPFIALIRRIGLRVVKAEAERIAGSRTPAAASA